MPNIVAPPTDLTAVSLFAGVGGIDLALTRAGVHVAAAVEIDDAARGVIADRLPKTTLLTDVTKVTTDDLLRAGFVPERGIIAAGWPCQGNSVAGGRAGLADPRSGLWRHVVRLLAELRPRWFLGENVPGLLSVTDGEDFGVVLNDVADLGYGFAYRVLDAQHFGVPQRRRRVFIVGHLGDARGPVEVLLEPEGSSGHPPQSGQAGQEVAATLTRGSSGPGVSAPGRRQEDDVNLVVTALTTKCGNAQDDQQLGQLVVRPLAVRGREGGSQLEVGLEGGPYNALRAGDGGSSRNSLVSITMPTLTASMGTNAGHPGDTGKDDMILAVADTLRSHPRPGSNSNGAIAFHMTQDPISGGVVPAMGAKSGGNGVQTGTVVRRLTPRECERLQGFPDDWTATSNGKPQADSARYRQMGNAVAVPCVEWIAHRIVAAS